MSSADTQQIPDIAATPAWQALQRHHDEIGGKTLREFFADDPERGSQLALTVGDLYIDYSKHRVSRDTLKMLIDLARTAGLEQRRGIVEWLAASLVALDVPNQQGRFPETTLKFSENLKPLSELPDYKVEPGDPDPRGWTVISTDGRSLGRVEDLVIDTSAMKVRQLIVSPAHTCSTARWPAPGKPISSTAIIGCSAMAFSTPSMPSAATDT